MELRRFPAGSLAQIPVPGWACPVLMATPTACEWAVGALPLVATDGARRPRAEARCSSQALPPDPGHLPLPCCRTAVGLGLNGTIPAPSGWDLPARLQYLEIGLNAIRGPIPPGWRLPDSACCCAWRAATNGGGSGGRVAAAADTVAVLVAAAAGRQRQGGSGRAAMAAVGSLPSWLTSPLGAVLNRAALPPAPLLCSGGHTLLEWQPHWRQYPSGLGGAKVAKVCAPEQLQPDGAPAQ